MKINTNDKTEDIKRFFIDDQLTSDRASHRLCNNTLSYAAVHKMCWSENFI